MARIRIWVELPDHSLRAYENEARRQNVPVESLVEQTVNTLLEELETEEDEGTDHPVTPR